MTETMERDVAAAAAGPIAAEALVGLSPQMQRALARYLRGRKVERVSKQMVRRELREAAKAEIAKLEAEIFRLRWWLHHEEKNNAPEVRGRSDELRKVCRPYPW